MKELSKSSGWEQTNHSQGQNWQFGGDAQEGGKDWFERYAPRYRSASEHFFEEHASDLKDFVSSTFDGLDDKDDNE